VNRTRSGSPRILPICASCKKVRDHEGAWTEAEISAPPSAQSHGICPDCLQRLYPTYSGRTPAAKSAG
jgi:hypothetical protein